MVSRGRPPLPRAVRAEFWAGVRAGLPVREAGMAAGASRGVVRWFEAAGMGNAQVAVAEYCPDWWPGATRLLVRRVLLDPEQVSADPRSRRRRTLHPDQRALPIPELARAGRSTPTASS